MEAEIFFGSPVVPWQAEEIPAAIPWEEQQRLRKAELAKKREAAKKKAGQLTLFPLKATPEELAKKSEFEQKWAKVDEMTSEEVTKAFDLPF